MSVAAPTARTTRRAPAHRADPADLTDPTLPAWPVLVPFVGYVLWWALGVGDLVWPLVGVLAVGTWVGVRGLRVPVVLLVWALLLAWMAASMTMTDTPGRAAGALFRLLTFAAAGVIALHVVNAPRRLPLTAVTGAATAFLGSATLGGLLALAVPTLTLRTPMAHLVPGALMGNELVHDMVVRRASQWVADSWSDLAVRPSAPFLYANTWGNVYSLVLPLALLHLHLVWHTRWRWPVLALVVLSAVPAAATLNRGMYVGLLVVALWLLLVLARRGRPGAALLGLGGIAAAGAAWYVSPAGQELVRRVATTSSSEDRLALYRDTVTAALGSPLLGWGAPRPADAAWMPSLGTQGQVWHTVFSHGVVGLALYLAFFVALLVVAWRRLDLVGAVLGGVVAATLVESFYYGMSTGIMVTMLAAGLLMRGDVAPARPPRHALSRRVPTRTPVPRGSSLRPRDGR